MRLVYDLIPRICIIAFTSIALLFSCATGRATFIAQTDLLVPWSDEAQGAFPDPPYAARYKKGAKRLTYVASTHEHEAPNPVFSLVKREYQALKPHVVVIEGLESSAGFSPKAYLELVPESPETGFWQAGEASYVAYLAHRNDVPFIGGEPSPQVIKDRLTGSKYSLTDLLYYYAVRQIGQWKRTDEDEGRTFDDLFSEFIGRWARIYRADPTQLNDIEAFRAWYREKNGQTFDYASVTTDVAAPLNDEDALYTQRLSHFNGLVRNANIVETIAEMLNRHNRVLVVFGAGHHVQQAEVLVEMMGEPELVQ